MEGSLSWHVPRSTPTELRERAVRMVLESRADYPSEYEAIRSIAGKLGITSPESLRQWVRRAEVDGGARPGKTTEETAESKEVEEGERRAAAGQRDPQVRLGLLRGGARPPTSVLIDCIRLHKEEFGVEPICRVLSEHGIKTPPPPSTTTCPGARRSGRCGTRRS